MENARSHVGFGGFEYTLFLFVEAIVEVGLVDHAIAAILSREIFFIKNMTRFRKRIRKVSIDFFDNSDFVLKFVKNATFLRLTDEIHF